MKKAITIAVLALCMSAFAGCGNTDSSSSSKKSSESVSNRYDENDDDDEAASSDEKETEEETEKETEEETEEATEAPTEAASGESSFQRGKVEGNVYTSEFANLRFEAPSGWAALSDEQLLQLMNISLQAAGTNVTPDDINKLLEEQVAVYDAQFYNASNSNVIFMIENLEKEGVAGANFTEDDYIKVLKQNFSAVQNVTYDGFTDVKSFEVGGNQYKYFAVTSHYQSMNTDVRQTYICRRIGNYMYSVIFSGCDDDEVGQFFGNFSPAK